MSVSSGGYIEPLHKQANAQGRPLLQNEFTLVVDGFEDSFLYFKQFPIPVLSTGDAIDRPSVLGTKTKVPGQTKFDKEGPFSLIENEAGQANRLLLKMICNGGQKDAWVYHGTPKFYTWKRRIKELALAADLPDADFESATILTLSGTATYMFYGEEVKGNVKTLYGADGQGGKC